MTQDKLGLGEQALNKIAEVALSTQLDEVERLEVQVKTDPGKLAQGELESITINGDGLVMHDDLRMENMEMQISAIAVNPLQALMGNIKLTQPAEGKARVVLTEADINRAFNSEFIRSKLQNIELNVEGKKAVIEPQQIKIQIPDSGKIEFFADTLLTNEIGATKQMSFIATILVKTSKQSLLLESFSCTPNQGISLELAIAVLQKIKELLNLPYLELDGMALRVQDVDVEKGKLTLHSEARVKQIPST